jgi:hypothetical protein
MKHSVLSANSVIHLKDSRSRSRRRCPFVKVSLLLGLACFALLPSVRAVIPAPDGGYANDNTAEGENAFFDLDVNNSTDNTAIGFDVLHFADVIFGDTAVGSQAMEFGSGNFNVAVGFEALFQNAGSDNTAIGASALGLNGLGNNNTAVGDGALFFNNNGNSNTCIGTNALTNNMSGSTNIAVGFSAGTNLSTGSNNIYIGSPVGSAGESNRIRIGTIGTQKNAFIAGIFGVTVAAGVPVIVDSNGRLGTTTSSKRFKDAIKPMDKASEAILALKPVTFHYKQELDRNGIPQFGLVAEEVAKVDPDLVVRDEQGKPYTVRYEAVNAMLLNEFLKEHRKVGEQEAKEQELEATVAQQEKKFGSIIAQQQKEIQALTASLKAQASQIQKVSDQLEVSRPAPQVVANNQ